MFPTPIHTEALTQQRQWTCLMILFIKMIIFQYQEATLSREIDEFMYEEGGTHDETMKHPNRTKFKRKKSHGLSLKILLMK